MLDLARLQRIQLTRVPYAQIALANTVLVLNYNWPPRTRIEIEGLENLPRDRGVFFAMNHTDRFNYWPFQYGMYRRGVPRYTATWVKGKYYENRWLGRFMDATNNIPLPSRGYVISTEFRRTFGRPPDETQYRRLRDLVDRRTRADAPEPDEDPDLVRFLDRGLADRDGSSFLERFDDLFDAMIREVVRLNRLALGERRLNILVFPQGTRSVRLSHGHTGLAQMAQHLGAPIVPVGCNGSDRIYPGNSPFARGGTVVYRVGKPLAVDGPELAPYRVPFDVLPLTDAASREHGDRYRAVTDVVMDAINELLDPPYRYSEDARPDGVAGVRRFL